MNLAKWMLTTIMVLGVTLAIVTLGYPDRVHVPEPTPVVQQPARAMPCEEDEVLIWVDVPHTVTCQNVEQLVTEELEAL